MEQTKMNAIIAKQNKTGYNKSSLKSILFCGLMSLGMLGSNEALGANAADAISDILKYYSSPHSQHLST